MVHPRGWSFSGVTLNMPAFWIMAFFALLALGFMDTKSLNKLCFTGLHICRSCTAPRIIPTYFFLADRRFKLTRLDSYPLDPTYHVRHGRRSMKLGDFARITRRPKGSWVGVTAQLGIIMPLNGLCFWLKFIIFQPEIAARDRFWSDRSSKWCSLPMVNGPNLAKPDLALSITLPSISTILDPL